MSVFKVVLFGIIAALCAFSIKEIRSDIAVLIGVAAGIIVLGMIIAVLSGIVGEVKSFFSGYSEIIEPIKSVVRIVSIGFVGDLACSIIEDCGQKSLSDKVALCVRIIIVAQILPIIKHMFEIINQIL